MHHDQSRSRSRTHTEADDRLLGNDAALAASASQHTLRGSLVRYYSLTKPRVTYGNVLTTAAGYLLAATGSFEAITFIAACLGTTLVIASACVLNNVLDRDIDAIMARTRSRASVAGSVRAGRAVAFATVLGVLGILLLAAWTNWLVVAVGVGGFIVYVVLYGMLGKRLSVHGTLVGSISGAAPILGGYVAATGAIDVGGILVFAVLFFWQMPAFYSISIYRRDEYAAAGIPVISVARGVRRTTAEIVVYSVVFAAATLLLPLASDLGWVYFLTIGLLDVGWIALAIVGLRAADPTRWARLMFRASMIILVLFSVMIAVGPLLP